MCFLHMQRGVAKFSFVHLRRKGVSTTSTFTHRSAPLSFGGPPTVFQRFFTSHEQERARSVTFYFTHVGIKLYLYNDYNILLHMCPFSQKEN